MNAKEQTKAVYLSPMIDILEIKVDSFLCLSVAPGGSEGTGDEELELFDLD